MDTSLIYPQDQIFALYRAPHIRATFDESISEPEYYQKLARSVHPFFLVAYSKGNTLIALH